MDAGVPIKAPVAGVAMGLISETGHADDAKIKILTDITGTEDHLGDMDFKVTGTEEGITAFQMDIKIKGITPELMRKALDMPEIVRKRRDKIGFYTPEKAWMDAHLADYRAVFENPDFRAGRYIDREKILGDWDSLTRGMDDIGLFRYICLEKWMHIFDVQSA